jgi:hypothetical protein
VGDQAPPLRRGCSERAYNLIRWTRPATRSRTRAQRTASPAIVHEARDRLYPEGVTHMPDDLVDLSPHISDGTFAITWHDLGFLELSLYSVTQWWMRMAPLGLHGALQPFVDDLRDALDEDEDGVVDADLRVNPDHSSECWRRASWPEFVRRVGAGGWGGDVVGVGGRSGITRRALSWRGGALNRAGVLRSVSWWWRPGQVMRAMWS